MAETEQKQVEMQTIPLNEFNKYERARVIGSRALQISMGAPFLIKLSDEELKKLKYNPLEIAKREFNEGVIPITVKRPLPKERAEKK